MKKEKLYAIFRKTTLIAMGTASASQVKSWRLRGYTVQVVK